MPHTSVTRRVTAPLATVWDVFTDVPTATAVLTLVRDVELLTRVDGGPGTRWRETRTVYGRTTTEELEVVRYEPERRYAVAGTSGSAHYRTAFAFDALGPDATSVLAVFDVGGTTALAGALGWLVWPVSRRTVRTALAADVHDLAAAAERRSDAAL